MTQLEPVDVIDPVILPPPISRPVGPAREKAMQHSAKDGALERKPMLALCRRSVKAEWPSYSTTICEPRDARERCTV
jgi:hypothetical protein